MSLYIEYEENRPSIPYNLTLPDDYDLMDILDAEDLPQGWNSESFTIKDLLQQSDDYKTKTINTISCTFCYWFSSVYPNRFSRK